MSNSIYWSRVISYANSTVKINCSGRPEKDLTQFLFKYLPECDTYQPHVQFWLSRCQDKQFCLYLGDELLIKSSNAATVAEKLLGDTCYHLVDKSHGGLLFHSAVVGWNNRGILFPGESGAGKSTLTAWLLSQKFTYLSDELAFIPHKSPLRIHAFTRPLNLKQPSRHVLESLLPKNHLTEIISNSRIWLIPPHLFNHTPSVSEISPQLIVFPHYQKNVSFEWHKLSAAQAGLALMKCLVNARNLPNHGFSAVVELTKTVPAYMMKYSDFRQIENHFETACMNLGHGLSK